LNEVIEGSEILPARLNRSGGEWGNFGIALEISHFGFVITLIAAPLI
jgi:hypothetical protein